MKKFEHGGDIYRNNVCLDFSANINPFGMPTAARSAVIENIDRLSDYPDPECETLCRAIAGKEGVREDNILCGNGAADLIFSVVRAVKPGCALLIAPTFSEYEKALQSVGCRIKYFVLNEENGFVLTESFLDFLTDIDMVFICNPNNPVGNVIDVGLMDRILKKCAQNDITAVVDECFMDFVPDGYSVKGKAIVIKAFTKLYAMAGIRLGYMIGDAGIIRDTKMAMQSWSVSTAAQIVGMAAVADTEYTEKSVKYINEERGFLIEELKELNFDVYGSQANFVFFKGDTKTYNELLKKGILIRSCENFRGLDNRFYRAAVKMHEENIILINALKELK